MTAHLIGTLVLSGFLIAAGCDNKKPQPPLKTPTAMPVAPAPTAPAPAATPAPEAANSTGPVVSVLGASLTLPPSWKRNPPANQMRLAEATVPDAGGDATKSCLVVFSTAGGTVDDNIARWSGQVRDSAGQPVKGTPQTQTIGGLKISVVELTGSFAGMDGAAKENWTLRGAIIEAPQGLVFIKMTGPAASVTAATRDFDSLVQSLKKS